MPSDTLGGWPAAAPVSVLDLFILFVGAPGLVFILVWVIGTVVYKHTWQPGPRLREALVIASGHEPGRLANIPTAAQLDRDGASPEPDEPIGGASARW
jgi:hypothetical protein